MDIFDLIDPAELTGYARTALADRPINRFQFSAVLPDDTVDDLDYRYNKGGGAGLVEAASYRTWDAEPGFGSRHGLARVSGELPPIARQMLLSEYPQLRLRNNPDTAIEDAIFDDAAQLVRSIDARLELARAQALVEGKVVLDEAGVIAEVDFGRKASHSVAAAVDWDDPASTPVEDLDGWFSTYVDTNGGPPARMVITNKIMQALKRNESLLKMFYPTVVDTSGLRLTNTQVGDVFAGEGWPRPTTYDARVRWKGANRRVFPEGTVLLLPPDGDGLDGVERMGATLWGTTLESQEPQYGVEDGERPGIVVGAFKRSTTPIQVFTIASAIAIPIVADPDLSFVASVGISE